MGKQSLTYGTLVLTASSLYNRILGFVYQILLVRLIRAEGIGLFSMIYPIYVLAQVVASAGIPVAIAKLVAEDRAQNNAPGAYRLFKVSLALVFGISLLVTVLMAALAPTLMDRVFPNPNVYLAFLVLLPGVFIVSVCSAFRGYFQGLQQMAPTAVSQAFEQTIRVVVGLVLAYVLGVRGVAYATAGASAGVVVGELAGLLLMTAIFLRFRPAESVRRARVWAPLPVTCARIFQLAAPVTLTRFVSTALLSVDALLIPQRLTAAGMEMQAATAAYGKLVGMAEAVMFTPGIITLSLATALVPAVSDALAQHNMGLLRKRVSAAVRVTLFVGIPSAALFYLLADHICGILFGYPDAGVLLATLALGAPFLYLTQTTTGILQGLGKAMDSFRNLVASSVIKIAAIITLTGMPALGAKGAALALAVHFAVMALLNLRDLCRHTGLVIEIKRLVVKPLVAAGVMTATVVSIGPAVDSIWHTLWAVGASGIAYLATLILLKSFTPGEIERIRAIIRRVIRSLLPRR